MMQFQLGSNCCQLSLSFSIFVHLRPRSRFSIAMAPKTNSGSSGYRRALQYADARRSGTTGDAVPSGHRVTAQAARAMARPSMILGNPAQNRDGQMLDPSQVQRMGSAILNGGWSSSPPPASMIGFESEEGRVPLTTGTHLAFSLQRVAGDQGGVDDRQPIPATGSREEPPVWVHSSPSSPTTGSPGRDGSPPPVAEVPTGSGGSMTTHPRTGNPIELEQLVADLLQPMSGPERNAARLAPLQHALDGDDN